MDTNKLQEMSAEELWTLHEEVASLLSSKIVAEKAKLDERHRKISGLSNLEQKRRSYPKVLPKYTIRKIPMKPGRVVASNLAGSRPNLD